jgi:DNA-directed RNA polymerase subunit N (RpoN/RPB10)
VYELVFPDADPDAVRHYNQDCRTGFSFARRPCEPLVDWSDTTYGEGVEVGILFNEEPRDSECQDVLNTLGASAYCLRRLEFDGLGVVTRP